MLQWLAWWIPEFRWWNKDKNCIYSLRFWGPFQTWLVGLIREDLDPETGHVEYAEVIWFSGMYVRQWLARSERKLAQQLRDNNYKDYYEETFGRNGPRGGESLFGTEIVVGDSDTKMGL